ncbi:uncharacterized protein LOC127642093 isoform X2 [Xyrauchen texanus]|uniref:uncharacterized protein LOC127642093 isoform X2 n=1 Tax=Xyrauchen texanus TaxID=154827 RepID=UPI002242B953|nr:uncharacterized protein LOC127642093 isoform X2 [Xyrauchen texanus]
MHPSSRPSVPPRSRRFDYRHPEAKPSQGTKREDKNKNTAFSSPRRGTRGPPECSRLKAPSQGARASVVQPKLVRPQKNSAQAKPAISKPKSGCTVSNLALDMDPNCNDPSLPCLCCDGHSPQDSSSLYNHNHYNNNTVTFRQQMKLAPPPPLKDKLAVLKQDLKEDEGKPEVKQPHAIPVEEKNEENGNVDEKDEAGLKNDDNNVNLNENVDVNGNGNGDGDIVDDDEDDEDDDTLVPSCCNCPESMLEFSLTSSTSSSSTSISSCSDLECDCPDTFSLSSQDQEAPECYPSSLPPDFQTNIVPLDLNASAIPPISPCSSDEGYPSAPSSPSSDYTESKASEDGKCIKVDLLNFIDSMEELGKVDLFYRIVQIAHWELDGELIVKDRLDHQQKLQRVNKEVKLAYLLKLQEEGLDFDDITGVLNDLGNISIPWKLYKNNKSFDSQEFSDAGVDLTAPSDLDETPLPDSLAPSPLDLPPPPRPPKPPKRHASAHPESHTYKTISGHTIVMSSTNDISPFSTSVSVPPLPQLSSSLQASKPLTLPPPLSQPVPYFTLNTDSPTFISPTPPIPPPRRRHKARLEAKRLAELEREKTLKSLPPPMSKPPPLPPPPALSPPPAIPPPPSLPPPPSFHVLDVEIRKLLALAGLTQAELLKLSPELGVCVDMALENDQQAISGVSQMGEITVDRTQKYNREVVDERLDSILREESRFGKDRSTGVKELDILSEKDNSKDEQKEANRTTSFVEARRCKRNDGNCNNSCSCGFGSNVTLFPRSYYSGNLCKTNIPNVSFGNFDYTSVMSDTPPPPPPPPPRPLPPRPPVVSNSSKLPCLKLCTLPANASRPDRFDWLIAFTPDTESPPIEILKSSNIGMLHKATSGSKVTTFKELRNRSKQSSPRAPVQPEPDPNVITPDPDFLYNLKWRKEKIDGDGWEYTSQAQASFLQPPPTPASLSLFREMCRLNIQDNCPAELASNASQQIGCSVSEGSLRTFCGERANEDHTKKTEDEEKVEVRGMADGAWTLESRTTAVRSILFSGSEQTNLAWMGDDVRLALKADELSSACLPEKRTLVNAVSVAVEAILAQFSSSRTVVQKALSGDSSVNPSLGRLVLRCLCPALCSLLSDGIKPHQSDLIAGRRPNSPWGLVQASTKPGPSTQALHSLQTKVAGLSQLKQSRHRFNAFLFGLLNIKLLDFWFSHLQSCSDVLETYYRPTSFMRLSLTSCQPLFEELLLLLQPLSLLTFNLDLLFQHHHLDPASPTLTPASHSSEIYGPPNEDFSIHLSPKGLFQRSGHHLGSVLEQDNGGLDLQSTNPNAGLTSLPIHALDVFEEGAYRVPVSLSSGVTKEKASLPLSWLKGSEISAPLSGGSGASLSQQAGQALQQGWGAVLRLGERLGQNFGLANSSSSEDVKGPNSPDDPKTGFSLNPKSPVENGQQPREELSLWDSGAVVPWGLGRLFGASKSPNNPPTSRRPSQWLSPGISVLTRIVNVGQGFPSEETDLQKCKEDESEMSKETRDQPRPLRVIRTLCDHTGNGTELSFRKGEELVLLGGVDHDWIRCRQGDKEGLVPIGYASLVM